MIAGCGDDEGGGGSEDGGVTPADLEGVNNSIAEINEQLTGLNTNVDGLNEQLEGLDGDLGDLTEDVQGRLEELENPDVLSCSVEELCIPDGIDLSTEGIADIIELVCEHEVDCCTEAELNLKFGPGITTAAECVSLFTDVVNNGLSPDFLQESPYIVYQIIGVAQALNDPEVRVELNAAGIADCVDSLQERECPEYTELEPSEPECIELQESEPDVCALSNLVNGLQEEGELCGEYGAGYSYYGIPECADGLYCSWDGAIEGDRGICSKLPEEGDGCQNDDQCDPFGGEGYGGNSTDLYCNLMSAQCEPLGNEGDPCEFIGDGFPINPRSRQATSQDCMPGLWCDPVANTCVGPCNEGYLCYAGEGSGDPELECGEGRVCNVTVEPKLWQMWNAGTCTDALEEGDDCTLGFDECGSGSCSEDCDLETNTCLCGEDLKQPGEDCDAPGSDALCVTGWCGADSTCVSFCDCDPNADWDCDWVNDEYGRDPEYCADGSYCDSQTYVTHPELSQGGYACEVKIENGVVCDQTTTAFHVSCESGFCDPDPGDDATGAAFVCSPKQPDTTDGACTSGYDEECPNNQYCNNDNICKPFLPVNGVCDLTNPSGLRCAAGLACVDGTVTDSCQPYAESGEDCNPSNVNEPQCDPDTDLSCIDIDGAGANTTLRCYLYDGGFADGVECQNNDSYCASGWCLPNGPETPTAYACAQPLEEGDDCDTADITLDKCAPGLFCNHPNGETEGKCAEQHEPGGSCKPYFAGVDCVSGCAYDPLNPSACPSPRNPCSFAKDQFLCNQLAQPIETLFCDGN